MRVPNTASEAFRTWSRLQEKSVKSPIWIGKCKVASSSGQLQDGGKDGLGEMRDWIQDLVAVCWDFGREMNGFRHGSENVAIVEISREGGGLCLARESRKMTVFSKRVARERLGWEGEEAIPKGMLLIEKWDA